MSLLRNQGSETLRDHHAHAEKIRGQLDQIAGLVAAGDLAEAAIVSRLGVIRSELGHLEGCATELEQAADRAHGLGITEAGE